MSVRLKLILFIVVIVSSLANYSCTKTPIPTAQVQIEKENPYGEFTFKSIGEKTNASAWSFSIVGQSIEESDEQDVVSDDLKKVLNRSFFGNEVRFQFYKNDTAKGLLFVSHEDEMDSVSFDIEINDIPEIASIEKIKLNTSDFDTNQVTLKIVQEDYDRDYFGLPYQIDLFNYEKAIVVQDTIVLDSVDIPLLDYDYRSIYYEGIKNIKIQFYDDEELLFEVPFDFKELVPSPNIFIGFDGVVRDWYPFKKVITWGSKELELFFSYRRI